MAIISFETQSGASIGFTEDAGMRLVSGVDQPALFDVVDVEGGVALRSIVPGWFVICDSDSGALVADGAEVEPRGTFELEDQGDGLVALRLAGRHEVGDAADDAPDVLAVGSVVRIRQPDTRLMSAGCCCGPGMDDGANWEEKTHAEIVHAAVKLMEGALDDPEVAMFVKAYWRDQKFQDELLGGLAQADEDPRYARPVLAGNCLNGGHFYDPTSGESYMRKVSSLSDAKVTALTEGRRYFNVAAWHARLWGDHRGEAGRLLGLSLHFLTDLTQPMHAANFINLCGDHYPRMSAAPEDVRRGFWTAVDWRHRGFERWVERDIASRLRNLPALTSADLETSTVGNCSELLHDAAVTSNSVFAGQLAAIADRKRGYDEDWPEAESVLADTLLAAPRRVARFLKYWMGVVQRPEPVDQQHWFRIKCSKPNAGGIGLHDTPPWGSHFIRSDDTGGNTLFFFLRNADGTRSIACRDWIENLWYGYDMPLLITKEDRTWLGEDKGGRRRDERRTHFMVVENGDTDGVWFFEPETYLAITIFHRTPYGGWIVTDEPCDPSDQVFHLERVEKISAQDHERIKARWPDWGGRA